MYINLFQIINYFLMDLSKDFNALSIHPGNNNRKSGKSRNYVVKSILDKRQEPNGSYSYLLEWESDNSTSWEPEENINKSVIARYESIIEFRQYQRAFKGHTDTRVYGYCRTSKGRVDNISIAVQKQVIIDYCIQNNYLIDCILTENGTSARNMNDLEELKYLLDYIKNVSSGGLKKVLAIYDVSRFSRNTAQALTILDDLKNNDIEVRFINDNLSTLTGFYNITIQLAAAQQLSDITSAKVRSAINFNRQHGFHTGGVSKIGYRVVNKRVVPDEHEIEVIKTVKRLQEEMKGVKNLHQNICNILNKNNIRLRGKPIPVSKVPLCLKRHIDLNL